MKSPSKSKRESSRSATAKRKSSKKARASKKTPRAIKKARTRKGRIARAPTAKSRRPSPRRAVMEAAAAPGADLHAAPDPAGMTCSAGWEVTGYYTPRESDFHGTPQD